MAIVPMKFVSACTDREHLDEMLMKTRTCGLLHPVSASEIVTEDNGGQLLNEDNPYSGYRQTIRNLAHSIGCEIKENAAPSKAYTKEEIEAFIAEITDKFGINSDSSEVLLTPDDEAALKELSKCGFERIHACRYLNFGFGRLPADSFPKLSMYGQENFVHHRCHGGKFRIQPALLGDHCRRKRHSVQMVDRPVVLIYVFHAIQLCIYDAPQFF